MLQFENKLSIEGEKEHQLNRLCTTNRTDE